MKTSKNISLPFLSVLCVVVCVSLPAAGAGGSGPLRRQAGLQPGESQLLHSKIGRPTTVLFVVPEGTVVDKGDLLVTLDDSDLIEREAEQKLRVIEAQAQMERAEAQYEGGREQRNEALAFAERAYKLAEMTLRSFHKHEYPLELSQAENELVLAQERLGLAGARVSYLEKAAEAGVEREFGLKEARLVLIESELQVKAAENRIRLLKDVVQERKKLELQLEVSRRKQDLARAREEASRTADRRRKSRWEMAAERYRVESDRLRRLETQRRACNVHAPRAGKVIYPRTPWGLNLRPGQMCAGTVVGYRQPLVEVIDPEHFKFTVPVTAERAVGVKAGQRVDVRFDAVPRTTFEGRVAEIVPLSEPQGATEKLIVVHFNHQDPRLRPGMTATLEF